VTDVRVTVRRKTWVRAHLLGLSMVMLLLPSPTFAALGGDVSTVQADQVHMQGTRRVQTGEAYSLHEIHAATGTVVREYVSPEGKVFAVAWQGPWFPDMRQLLGSYFEEYARAAQSQSSTRIGRRPLHIELPDLNVQIVGHPRAFAGRAYVPAMLPQGFRAEDIR
jgi:uncharacterized protein DUF2844